MHLCSFGNGLYSDGDALHDATTFIPMPMHTEH